VWWADGVGGPWRLDPSLPGNPSLLPRSGRGIGQTDHWAAGPDPVQYTTQYNEYISANGIFSEFPLSLVTEFCLLHRTFTKMTILCLPVPVLMMIFSVIRKANSVVD
jgi:hypothetical protein